MTEPKQKRPRRPRHPQSLPMTRDERIKAIQELMLRNDWHGRKSHAKYATAWGCSAYTLRNDAIEASRELKAVMNDEDLIAMIEERLDAIAVVAIEKGDASAATGAYRLQLEARGVLRHKYEHRIEIAGMSDDEVTAGCIDELVRDNRTRDKVRAALAAWDEKHSDQAGKEVGA